MFIFDLAGATTIFDNVFSGGRVWIKVCNVNFGKGGTNFKYYRFSENQRSCMPRPIAASG